MSASLSDRIVAETLSWLGTPYRHQGSRKGVGCDCLGLVLGVWRALYRDPPEDPGSYAPDWAWAGQADRLTEGMRRHCLEKAPDERARGDIVLFRWGPGQPARHAGILVAPGRFAHACQGGCVTTATLALQWKRRLASVFAFPDLPY